MSVKRRGKTERLIFASTVYPSSRSETDALLLAESIRAFGGSLDQAPIWFLTPEVREQLSAAFKKKLLALGVSLIAFKIDDKFLDFPFAGDVFAAALTESKLLNQTRLLAWLGTNTFVVQEPKAFLLPDDKVLGFRPVHHTLIGSRYDEPVDGFWNLIYHLCNVPATRIFPMTTHIDGTRIRPYFNAGLLVTRPERSLLQAWRDTFLRIYQEPSFQSFYQSDERYRIFLHQTVLSGVILSKLKPSQIQELPATYNYPVHLHTQDVTDNRPACLEELVTFRHERFYTDQKRTNNIPAKQPLKQWIAKRLPPCQQPQLHTNDRQNTNHKQHPTRTQNNIDAHGKQHSCARQTAPNRRKTTVKNRNSAQKTNRNTSQPPQKISPHTD